MAPIELPVTDASSVCSVGILGVGVVPDSEIGGVLLPRGHVGMLPRAQEEGIERKLLAVEAAMVVPAEGTGSM